MTVTTNPHSNGRMQRKSLADQLDRFDGILDGLDQALQGAITDAVKEAVSTAVSEAVRATLIEVVTNPDVISLLRGGVPRSTEKAEDEAPPIEKKSVLGRIRNAVSAAWNQSLAKVRGVGSAVADRVRKVRNNAVATYAAVNSMWRLKRPLTIALGVGVVVGTLGYLGSSWCAGLLSGVGAMGTALGTQLALWTRRLFGGIAVH